MYELLEDSTGLKFCVFNALAGVGRCPSCERAKFERIWQKTNLEYYKCPYCMYIAIGPKCNILFKDISELKETKKALYLSLLEGEDIPINKQTFSIRCTLNEPKCPEGWVNVYTSNKI